MSLSSNRTGDTVTVAVSGELDLGTCAAVDAAIVDAVDAPGVAEVRVDLSALTFMDSSGISLLLKGRRRADERGVAYWVAGVRGTPRQVLEITGVLSHLTGGGADAGGEADAGGTSGTGGAGGTGGTGGAGGTGGTGGAGGIPGQRPAGA